MFGIRKLVQMFILFFPCPKFRLIFYLWWTNQNARFKTNVWAKWNENLGRVRLTTPIACVLTSFLKLPRMRMHVGHCSFLFMTVPPRHNVRMQLCSPFARRACYPCDHVSSCLTPQMSRHNDTLGLHAEWIGWIRFRHLIMMTSCPFLVLSVLMICVAPDYALMLKNHLSKFNVWSCNEFLGMFLIKNELCSF